MANETVKRIEPEFTDDRGAITNVLEKPINHVAIITSKKGTVRANHYHPEQTQYVYLISGKYESLSKDLRKGDDAEVEKAIIEAGSLVITPTMVAHAMRFLENSIMLNMTTADREPANFDRHTKKYKLI